MAETGRTGLRMRPTLSIMAGLVPKGVELSAGGSVMPGLVPVGAKVRRARRSSGVPAVTAGDAWEHRPCLNSAPRGLVAGIHVGTQFVSLRIGHRFPARIAGSRPMRANFSSAACRHAPARHGHPGDLRANHIRREATEMLAKWASHIDVDGRDKPGDDGKGGWEPLKASTLRPWGRARS